MLRHPEKYVNKNKFVKIQLVRYFKVATGSDGYQKPDYRDIPIQNLAFQYPLW